MNSTLNYGDTITAIQPKKIGPEYVGVPSRGTVIGFSDPRKFVGDILVKWDEPIDVNYPHAWVPNRTHRDDHSNKTPE